MFKKILIIFVLPMLLYSCGYSTLYSNTSGQNINIKVTEFTGDQEINNYLLNNLKKYSRDQDDPYLVTIDTNYSILESSKNIKGSVSNFDLIATTKFQVTKNNLSKTIIIKENITIKNLSNNLEKKNYEKSIKKNFSISIVNKLILQLSSIQ